MSIPDGKIRFAPRPGNQAAFVIDLGPTATEQDVKDFEAAWQAALEAGTIVVASPKAARNLARKTPKGPDLFGQTLREHRQRTVADGAQRQYPYQRG